MATEALKSTPVTNSDASPPTLNSPGEGGIGEVRSVTSGAVTGTTGVTSGSTYQLVRLPSNAKLKQARFKLDAGVTTFAGDIGFYYSSGVDGTVSAFGKVNSNTGGQLLGAAVDLHAQTTWVDQTSNITAANMVKPLWSACGLTTDPGGFFDLVITTTSTTSGAPVMCADVLYTV